LCGGCSPPVVAVIGEAGGRARGTPPTRGAEEAEEAEEQVAATAAPPPAVVAPFGGHIIVVVVICVFVLLPLLGLSCCCCCCCWRPVIFSMWAMHRNFCLDRERTCIVLVGSHRHRVNAGRKDMTQAMISTQEQRIGELKGREDCA